MIFHFLKGEDGPSQMALEDFAMFRSIPGCACFYPSDAVSCERAIELAANHKGMTFTRTSRPATPVIYTGDEKFEIGKGKVHAYNKNHKKPLTNSTHRLCFPLTATKLQLLELVLHYMRQ